MIHDAHEIAAIARSDVPAENAALATKPATKIPVIHLSHSFLSRCKPYVLNVLFSVTNFGLVIISVNC
jgi:hypothetical protein